MPEIPSENFDQICSLRDRKYHKMFHKIYTSIIAMNQRKHISSIVKFVGKCSSKHLIFMSTIVVHTKCCVIIVLDVIFTMIETVNINILELGSNVSYYYG